MDDQTIIEKDISRIRRFKISVYLTGLALVVFLVFFLGAFAAPSYQKARDRVIAVKKLYPGVNPTLRLNFGFKEGQVHQLFLSNQLPAWKIEYTHSVGLPKGHVSATGESIPLYD